MANSKKSGFFAHIGADLSAGVVVFLVAVPLCLGIAQASGAPLLSGLIAGIMGGIVVSLISRSELSVSGPAAGLAVIVATGIQDVGFRGLLLAVVIAGALQLVMGFAKLGRIAHFFPASVIKGMLAAIGVLIILKQLPHAVGYDQDFEGDDAFFQADGENTFSAIFSAFEKFDSAAVAVTITCVVVLLVWPKLQGSIRFLRFIPAPLMVVVGGAVASLVLPMFWSGGALSADHLVALPVFESASDVKASIVLPEFHRFAEVGIWKLGITLAIVASIETLLSVEAVDRLDPHKRISPPNRELMAQGTANLLSGFIGGLPVTAVIVRSSANVVAGGQTRLSALFHGLLLLAGVLFFGSILNTIPLAALAVVLIAVGLKLTNRKLWVSMWKAGAIQFAPFAITVLAVVFTDLLTGTMIGLAAGVILMLREQRKNSVFVTMEDDKYVVRATKDLTFLQKAQVKEILGDIPDGATVHIDRSGADFVDPDVEELFEDFEEHCRDSGIQLEWTRREASDEVPPTDAARSEVAA